MPWSRLAPTFSSQLQAQVTEIKSLLNARDNRVPRVSGWSSHQHLDHMLKVMKLSLSQLLSGEKLTPRNPRLTFPGWAVLLFGKIPRGRIQAPEIVQPDNSPLETLIIEVESLEGLFPQLYRLLEQKDFLRRTMKHPTLGILTASHWLRFLVIHNNHHLKIIRELEES
jgi:Protein of unknown function (DUF1569)